MKELKMGDIVEVCVVKYNSLEEIWEPYIFIKMGINNTVIVVKKEDEQDYKDGWGFNIFKTDIAFKWRIPEESKYRPFTFEDRELFKDKWIKYKNNENEVEIRLCFVDKFSVFSNELYTYEELLRCFTFLDGSPCGVKIEE